MAEKARLIIEVSGGVVQAVWGGDFVEVLIVDWDEENDHDRKEPYEPEWRGPDGPESEMATETADLVALADAAR